MIQQTLTSSMSIADLAPKAATRLPEQSRGDGAFGEALAGARSVHDRNDSRADTAYDARDTRQVDRSDASQRVQDTSASRADRGAEVDDRGDARPVNDDDDHHADTDHIDGDRSDAAASSAGAADTTDRSGEQAAVAAPADAAAEAAAAAAASGQVAGDTDAEAGRAAVVAVAAAPVDGGVDAIMVPTTTAATASHATDAVDAAIRMAIAMDAGADAAGDAAATPAATATATATTTVDTAAADAVVDADPALLGAARPAGGKDASALARVGVAAAQEQGTEDADAGDVTTGPTRPFTSMPTTTSGPSPAQLTAATFAEPGLDAAGLQQATTQAVATSATTAVASGDDAPDAATQLVQSVAIASTDDASLDPNASSTTTATTATTATTQATAAAGEDGTQEVLVDPEQPTTTRPTQSQTPTVSVNAQVQAHVQARAAEQAAEQAGAEAPVDADGAAQPIQPLSATRTEAPANPALRMREAIQGGGDIQERIDHIADQLATRLRLSQAAGGSQV